MKSAAQEDFRSSYLLYLLRATKTKAANFTRFQRRQHVPIGPQALIRKAALASGGYVQHEADGLVR